MIIWHVRHGEEKKLDSQYPLILYVGSLSAAEWGYSSAGRALEWHSRGQRFDPA